MAGCVHVRVHVYAWVRVRVNTHASVCLSPYSRDGCVAVCPALGKGAEGLGEAGDEGGEGCPGI